MKNTKLILTIISVLATIGGIAVDAAKGYVDDKKQDEKIEKKIDEAFDKKLTEAVANFQKDEPVICDAAGKNDSCQIEES